MEIREIILVLAGFSVGFGSGLAIYAVHRLRETSFKRYQRKAHKRYAKLMANINDDTARMKASVKKLTDLKTEYTNAR